MPLTRLTSAAPVRRITAYDFEWVPGTLQIRVCGALDERGYRWYGSVEAFLDGELTHANRGRWYYAHAGGLADVQFILHRAKQHLPDTEINICYSGSSAVIVRIRKGKHSWLFVDSLWTLKDVGIADIAEALGRSKYGSGMPDPTEPNIDQREMERRYEQLREWYAIAPLSDLVAYNESDCSILYEALNRFQDFLLAEGGQLNATIASTAMATFRRSFLTRDLEIAGGVNAMLRPAYDGGRVEVFRRYLMHGVAYDYDINSSYPYQMASCPVPGDYLGSRRDLPDDDTIYFANVTVEVPDCEIPPVPYRVKERLYYPTGSWRRMYSRHQLELLVECGGKVVKVHDVFLFADMYDMGGFANHWYGERQKARGFRRTAIKYLLNSLYGKFGERSLKEGAVLNPTAETDEMTYRGPGIFEVVKEVDIPHEHVAIAAWITSGAACDLTRRMRNCDSVYYCDTDGFVSPEPLTTGNKLGGLKTAGVFVNGQWLAPKVYAERKQDGTIIVKAKGFRRSNYADFIRIAEGITVERPAMRRVRGNIRRGNLTPNEYVISKTLRLDKRNAKRYYYPNGTSRPLSIEEIEVRTRRSR